MYFHYRKSNSCCHGNRVNTSLTETFSICKNCYLVFQSGQFTYLCLPGYSCTAILNNILFKLLAVYFETLVRGERRMNPVAIARSSILQRKLAVLRVKPATPVLKPCTLLTELAELGLPLKKIQYNLYSETTKGK